MINKKYFVVEFKNTNESHFFFQFMKYQKMLVANVQLNILVIMTLEWKQHLIQFVHMCRAVYGHAVQYNGL